MTTGQAQIAIKDSGSLDLSGVTANAAMSPGESADSVDGQDIYPRSVTTDHLYASNATIYGILKSGSIYVGSGGVTISSEEDGATPTTGILISSSKIILKSSSVDVVTLDGTDGSFVLRSAAAGERMELDTSGISFYNSDDVLKTGLNADSGLYIYNDGGLFPSAIEKIALVSGEDLETTSEIFSYTYDYGMYKRAGVRINAGQDSEAYTVGEIHLCVDDFTYFNLANLNLTELKAYSPVQISSYSSTVTLKSSFDRGSLVLDGSAGTAAFSNLDLSADNFDAVETSWTLSAGCSGSMTISIANGNAYYSIIGPWCFFWIRCLCTLGGTPSDTVYFSLGRDAASANALGRSGGGGIISRGSTDLAIVWTGTPTYDDNIQVQMYNSGNFSLGSGREIKVQGFYAI
ncbi:MAG: hypothetical protein WC322_06680 [Candidatus Paceibacterota bacterium]|jgi:hypothetical protein